MCTVELAALRYGPTRRQININQATTVSAFTFSHEGQSANTHCTLLCLN